VETFFHSVAHVREDLCRHYLWDGLSALSSTNRGANSDVPVADLRPLLLEHAAMLVPADKTDTGEVQTASNEKRVDKFLEQFDSETVPFKHFLAIVVDGAVY